MPGAERRPGQEKLAAFGGAGLPGPAEGNERREHRQQPHLDRPLNLAGNIRALVAEARATWPLKDVKFNAAWWLDERLESVAHDAFAIYKRSGYQEEPEDKLLFLIDLRIAWRLVTYEQQNGESGSGYTYLSGQANLSRNMNGRTSSITLSPLGVSLLDAMAEALDIPDHTIGQGTFDLSLFNTYAQMERLRRNAPNLAPTKEEVKRAINPKPENIIDDEQ